jgi:biotin carboxyl carrier protein
MEKRKFRITIDGKVFEAEVEEIGGPAQAAPSQPSAAPSQPAAPQPAAPAQGNTIVSPMPGKIVSIKVSKGQQVNQGDVVLILEAMKMEQEIKSTISGTVSDIAVSEGETVRKEQPLIVL